MQAGLTSEFIRRIPKTDLHLHLDGSLRLSTLIELAKQGNIELPSYTEEGLKETVFKDAYASLPEYLAGFAYTVGVMQNAENIERIAYELVEDNLEEGVRYIEVRFAPQLHQHSDLDFEAVIKAVTDGMNRAKNAHNNSTAVKNGDDIEFEFGIIFCALRYFNEHMSHYYRNLCAVMEHADGDDIFSAASMELAKAAEVMAHEKGYPVVGFDLAGAEAGFPADDHWRSFKYAHDNFIRKTVHAGEAYGPESIFQAITQCYANRIGHGTWLFASEMIQNKRIKDPKKYVEYLAQYIASQRITIEVNLTSNLQTTPTIKNVADHPLKMMLEKDLSVSICTDNRLVSNTTVSRELELVANEIPITRKQFRNLVIAGFKGSFFPDTYNNKRAYVRKVIDQYEKVENELLNS